MSRLSILLFLSASPGIASDLPENVQETSTKSQPANTVQLITQEGTIAHNQGISSTPNTPAPFRSISQDAWKKLSTTHQHKISPKKEEVFAAVTTAKFGSQFTHLGPLEDDFIKECRLLNQNDTVLINADAYGRLSLKAFRYNAHLRVIYNDMDPQNATSIMAFKNTCLVPEENLALPVIMGDCVTLKDQETFKALFPAHNPQDQLSLIFAANVAHFLSPSRLVTFLAHDYDLLKPGGMLRLLASGFVTPPTLNPTLTLKTMKKRLDGLSHIDVSALQGHFSTTFSTYLKEKGFTFYGYFDKGKLNASKTMTGPDKALLNNLFPGDTMQMITLSALTTIADAIGYHVVDSKNYSLRRAGGFAEEKTGDYLGVTLQKPHGAPGIEDAAYFRKSDAFLSLEKLAKKEESEIAVLFRDSKLQNKHPYLILPSSEKRK
ncbi:MAG: hypothetical protein H2057_00700 [Alphaproteobacteria bacterium]|nr:hypothetical protein [Alphaproteobacteria bacterium]